jgi:catechol 2,3-dioxygenase-like lactoylglutathione lyase family enzyme
MDPRISLITLGVDDLERATDFYHDGLDLPIADASTDDITFFDTHGTTLALYGRDSLAADATIPADGTGFAGIALAHNVDSKARVDAVLDEAETAGATIVKPAQDAFWGGYSGYFTDPDDHLWEVAWNPDYDIPA